jgi:hypothetical protein
MKEFIGFVGRWIGLALILLWVDVFLAKLVDPLPFPFVADCHSNVVALARMSCYGTSLLRIAGIKALTGAGEANDI